MDKRDNNNRSVKSTGRKVVKNEYDWEAFERRTNNAKNNAASKGNGKNDIHLLTEEEIKKRYQKQQKQDQLKMKRIRAAFLFLIIVMLFCVLIFMTPVFNIRSISVTGNQIVTLEEIDSQVSDLMGQNLFKTGGSQIEKRLKNIAYIESASTSKRLFPPSVKITVKEYEPAGYININGYEVIVNSDLKVLDDKNSLPTDEIPEISGVNSEKYTVGKVFKTDNPEKDEILQECLSLMEQTGIINDVNEIDVSNITGIEFKYQDRINVLCGTQLDLGRKLNLFKEAIHSNNIADDAKGTIDLSVTGKAVHIP